MKKISEVLNHIENNPELGKVSTYAQIRKFIEILPPKLKKGVKFAYIRNQTFTFVLTHQVYKMEFEYNKEDIKSLLKKYKINDVNNVLFFVTNKIEKREKNTIEDEPKYKERSYGIFQNMAKDDKLFSKFENIRKIIKEL